MFALYHQHVLPFEITIRLLIEEEINAHIVANSNRSLCIDREINEQNFSHLSIKRYPFHLFTTDQQTTVNQIVRFLSKENQVCIPLVNE